MIQKVELDLDGRTLTIETGRVARQADGSVLVSMGDTVVMGVATMSDRAREGIDFFPLVCDYEERKYAVGKIPGGFVKRGGRPSEKAILTSRLIDRPLRPMFPYGMRNEVQVICIPLSVELVNPPDVLSMVAASAALTISRIPFEGPIGAVRVARVDGEFVFNPTWEQTDTSDLNVVVAGTRNSILTVDVESKIVDESVVLDAIDFAQSYIDKIIELQEKLAALVGTPKAEPIIHSIPAGITDKVRELAADRILAALRTPEKAARLGGINTIKEEMIEALGAEFPDQSGDIAEAVEKIAKEELRKLIMNEGVRADGRKLDDIRKITSEVGLLPRAHGSGLFTRGQTQVLTTVVLGSIEDAQIVDTLEEDGVKRYMHYYNFPPFSVGETRPLRGPGRREIGHGALAEKALDPVIPPKEEFPYALLLTSDVLESNGSTSMASTCGSTLALMDAGVKIKAPVAGAAMGLMTDGERCVVLSDIMDLEDFYGDMDFKVAGSAEGITAIQMDTKIQGIPRGVLNNALEEAKKARLFILDRMLEAIAEPRPDMSAYAPRVLIVEIHPDKIGEVIGPGGKVIKKIEAETGASLSIEQDGHVFITASDKEGGERAKKMVEDITREVRIGETYTGKVVKIAAFGAFVEILPGRDGLIHVSALGPGRVNNVEDVVKLGQEIIVRVSEINPQGKINLVPVGAGEGGEQQPGQAPQQREQRPPRPAPPRRPAPGPDDDMPKAKFRPKR